MLAAVLFASAIGLATPNPIHVHAGERVVVEVDISPSQLIYGGWMCAEDTAIASVAGAIPARGSSATTTVRGLRAGQTRLMVSFVSGFSVYCYAIGAIIVDACETPTVTLPAQRLRVGEQQANTLEVMTSGTPQPDVHWYDGGVFAGIGNPLTVELASGVHRITAYAVNPCGMAIDEMEIEVVADRRRSVRH
jgi:hypothetical protein